MPIHPDPIQNLEAQEVIPWEPLGQIAPKDLPGPSEKYPGPWKTSDRGNGHIDLMDAQNRVFAHVYCWDDSDWGALEAALKETSKC